VNDSGRVDEPDSGLSPFKPGFESEIELQDRNIYEISFISRWIPRNRLTLCSKRTKRLRRQRPEGVARDLEIVNRRNQRSENDRRELKEAKLVFKGDRYTVRRGSGPTVTGTLKLNPTKNPKSIDITDANGPYKGKALLGIYTLKGNKLTECFSPPGGSRPAQFATESGTSQFIHVWKHVKD